MHHYADDPAYYAPGAVRKRATVKEGANLLERFLRADETMPETGDARGFAEMLRTVAQRIEIDNAGKTANKLIDASRGTLSVDDPRTELRDMGGA